MTPDDYLCLLDVLIRDHHIWVIRLFFWQEQELLFFFNKSHPVLSRIKCQKFTVSSQFAPKRLLCDVWCECVSACMFVFSFQRVCISSFGHYNELMHTKWVTRSHKTTELTHFVMKPPKAVPKMSIQNQKITQITQHHLSSAPSSDPPWDSPFFLSSTGTTSNAHVLVSRKI